MTAEIAIMNKEAIALAADSAVTMSTAGQRAVKIFPSANKLFTLSKFFPIGIMVYGNAQLMGIPWETIIKLYRDKLGNSEFDTLNEYSKKFIDYFNNNEHLFPESIQDSYLKNDITGYFELIKSKLKDELESKIKEIGQIDDEIAKEIASKIIADHYEIWSTGKEIPFCPSNFEEDSRLKYDSILDESIKSVFENFPLTDEHKESLKKIAILVVTRFSEKISNSDNSGVVIAGFGKNDIFPILENYKFERIINNKLKYIELGTFAINKDAGARIIPFAQSEMVSTFMEGVDPGYKSFKDGYIFKIFNDYAEIIINTLDKYSESEKGNLKTKLANSGEQLVTDLNIALSDYRRKYLFGPILNVVSGLPREELASMAEALVNLTSLKRRVTPENETVGGPIDVAIITKGDGFIWIKRKHYFRAELNPQFRENYYKECRK